MVSGRQGSQERAAVPSSSHGFSTPAESPEALAALERAFSDPLISPGSRRRLQPGPPAAADGVPEIGSGGRSGSGAAESAGDLPGITIFAGVAVDLHLVVQN